MRHWSASEGSGWGAGVYSSFSVAMSGHGDPEHSSNCSFVLLSKTWSVVRVALAGKVVRQRDMCNLRRRWRNESWSSKKQSIGASVMFLRLGPRC